MPGYHPPLWVHRLLDGARHHVLLLRFGAVSAVIMLGLGVHIGNQLHSVLSARAQANAVASAQVYLQLVSQQFLRATAVPDGTPVANPQQLALLQELTAHPVIAEQVLGATAWLPDGTVAFSTARAETGTHEELSAPARAALAGEVVSELADSSRVHSDRYDPAEHAGEPVMVVTMPLSLVGDEGAEAVVEVVTDYEEAAEAVERDTSTVSSWRWGGLTGLHLALMSIVAVASRRDRRQSAANRDLALHDTLTGLPNRTLLRDRAQQAITAGVRHGHGVALLLLDLDRFKEINDTLGHHPGDVLLTMIGPRLASVLRTEDTVARLGGDEFVVLLPRVDGWEAAVVVAQRLLAALDEPFPVDGLELDVAASLGIAVSPEHGEDFETLLRHADVAMYAAKEHQTGTAVYDSKQDANSPARLALLGELRRALEEGQLVLHYQPKADLGTGRITGVEALVRWQHPTRGLLAPDEFIPLAERTGLIRQLTLIVLDDALAQAARWAAAGRPLAVAVNISARSLLDLDLRDDVATALERYGVPGESLVLEITESSVMVDPDRALEVLRSLAALGVSLSLDDFGTGYSSLAHLQRLPVHELKIDRSFVMNLTADTNDVIVSASIDLAHNLGLHVIAEGVEDQATWDRLAELGCQSAQGYLLSRPVPADVLAGWLDARTLAAAAG